MSIKIKSFIYLDDYKLYSLSSQLFKGFTEYIISGTTASHTEEESQKGTFSSGKVMGDLLEKVKTSTEKKFLHDYAFNLLEAEFVNQGLLYKISSTDTTDTVQSKSIIKVTGRAIFNDYRILQGTMSRFNSIGESFGHFQFGKILEDLNKVTADAIKKTNDRNQRSKVKNLRSSIDKKMEDILRENRLRLTEKDVEHMANLMEYGFHGELEFRIIPDNLPFQLSAILNREYLRDTEEHFVSKYSRQSEYDFTMIGIVTQSGKNISPLSEHEPNGIKDACLNLADKLTVMENVFLGRLDNECIIDPIAIYREL